MKIMVMGIGNVLLRDEGVGVRVAERLADEFRDTTVEDELEILDGGTLSFTLAANVGSADRMIVIDAARLDEPPGTLRTFIDADMDAFLGTRKRSVHEVGLLDLMDMARLTGDLPAQRALVGIQPEAIDWGSELTPRVAARVEDACRIVRSLIIRWEAADEPIAASL